MNITKPPLSFLYMFFYNELDVKLIHIPLLNDPEAEVTL